MRMGLLKRGPSEHYVSVCIEVNLKGKNEKNEERTKNGRRAKQKS